MIFVMQPCSPQSEDDTTVDGFLVTPAIVQTTKMEMSKGDSMVSSTIQSSSQLTEDNDLQNLKLKVQTFQA